MIHFNWDINSLDHLEVALREEYSGITITPVFNQTLSYLSSHEKKISLDAQQSKKTLLHLEDVSYYLNNVGARGNWDVRNINKNDFIIVVFGCSFTFGVGMPYESTFSSIILRRLSKYYPNAKLINLGFPGGSISKTLKLYKYLTDCCKVDIAIFNFPTQWREELVIPTKKFTPNKTQIINFQNLIPNVPPSYNKDLEKKHKEFYSYTTNQTALYNNFKNISHIDLIGKYHNIHNYYTSWDYDIYNLIKIKYPSKTLPYFNFYENRKLPPSDYFSEDGNIYKYMGFARDGMHPGVLSHGAFGDTSANYILIDQKKEKKLTKPNLI